MSYTSVAHNFSLEMSQSFNVSSCGDLVVSGRFSEILKVWSSGMSREDFERLASNHEG